ncbi:MAG: apolipoprotein N-acyltransferase [Candidatus Cryptobacteroides sp.]
MNKHKRIMAVLAAMSLVMMSLPFLVPHLGILSLFGLVPLLCMEFIGTQTGVKRMWLWHYSVFVAWNAVTTFWVCNATVGGGIFACLANALQMSIVFGMFRWSRKVLKGILPYIFLVFLWIAWERYYLTVAQISWPWLVLGNSFARTVSLVQWYEFTGTLGGSLWIWICNIWLFSLMLGLASGKLLDINWKRCAASVGGYVLMLAGPIVLSLIMYCNYSEKPSGTLEALVLQPDFDPYQKFQSMSQAQQNAILIDLMDKGLKDRKGNGMVLALAPETFTGDIVLGRLESSPTWRRFTGYLKDKPGVNLMFGASTYEYTMSDTAPSKTVRSLGENRWVQSRNSALIIDSSATAQIYHKSKLVVGVEMTPYPALFTKIDDLLGGVMGRCAGQDEVSLLDCIQRDTCGNVTRRVPVGCAICYESVYPEHCAEYVRKGAQVLTVITNDAWWGNTPGYRQHLSYAALRAIETRRWIARSANTGISAVISSRGDIIQKTSWWEREWFRSDVNLNDEETFFVRYGDITGRICTFMAVLLLLGIAVRAFVKRRENASQ